MIYKSIINKYKGIRNLITITLNNKQPHFVNLYAYES